MGPALLKHEPYNSEYILNIVVERDPAADPARSTLVDLIIVGSNGKKVSTSCGSKETDLFCILARFPVERLSFAGPSTSSMRRLWLFLCFERWVGGLPSSSDCELSDKGDRPRDGIVRVGSRRSLNFRDNLPRRDAPE